MNVPGQLTLYMVITYYIFDKNVLAFNKEIYQYRYQYTEAANGGVL